MNEKDFAALMEGAEEVMGYLRGEKKNLRTTVVPAPPRPMTAAEIRRLREDVLKASQSVFAIALNVSTSTVQAWEAGNRHPTAGNLKLLRVGEEHPEVIFGSLYGRESTV
jgi:putative transcriptional regulator